MKNNSYFNRLQDSFYERFDIYFLYFLVFGIITLLLQKRIFDFGSYYNVVMWTYLILKILWVDVPNRKNSKRPKRNIK